LGAAYPDPIFVCVNPCKAKHLTKVRSQGEGKGIQLESPLRMSLERAIEFIDIDEYVEATPKSLRLRKRILDATARKRAAPNLPNDASKQMEQLSLGVA
jgi:GTP-binding protein